MGSAAGEATLATKITLEITPFFRGSGWYSEQSES